MAKRSASPDKLTIRGLSPEDQEWLRAESDRLGCDSENLVRMMIRQRSAMTPLTPQPPPNDGRREWDSHVASVVEELDRYSQVDRDLEERDRQTINEAEPSLDAVMAARPSLLDEPPAPPRPRIVSTLPERAFRRHYDGGRLNSAPYPRGGFDAFTETEFVGINQAVIGANMMGDGTGNVLRDNLRHFGVKGTVRR